MNNIVVVVKTLFDTQSDIPISGGKFLFGCFIMGNCHSREGKSPRNQDGSLMA